VESREIVDASVENELATLAELASSELSVEARLCFDVLRRSKLSGRAVPDGMLGAKLAFLPDEAQIRPKKRLAAVVISDARAAFAVTIRDSL
jgi:hypothetical protein